MLSKRFFTLIAICFVFVAVSSCMDSATSPDISGGLDLPTVFPGLESDILYVASSVITRIDKQTNEKIRYPYPELSFTVNNLRISEDGRFAYFLDQSVHPAGIFSIRRKAPAYGSKTWDRVMIRRLLKR